MDQDEYKVVAINVCNKDEINKRTCKILSPISQRQKVGMLRIYLISTKLGKAQDAAVSVAGKFFFSTGSPVWLGWSMTPDSLGEVLARSATAGASLSRTTPWTGSTAIKALTTPQLPPHEVQNSGPSSTTSGQGFLPSSSSIYIDAAESHPARRCQVSRINTSKSTSEKSRFHR